MSIMEDHFVILGTWCHRGSFSTEDVCETRDMGLYSR